MKAKDYDTQTLIEITTKMQALEHRLEHGNISLDQAEQALELYNTYTRRILDLTLLIQRTKTNNFTKAGSI